MSILFKCVCGKALKAPDKLAGKAIKCPGCSARIKVPVPSGRPPSKPQAEKPAPRPDAPLDDLSLDEHAPEPAQSAPEDQPLDFGPELEMEAPEEAAPPPAEPDQVDSPLELSLEDDGGYVPPKPEPSAPEESAQETVEFEMADPDDFRAEPPEPRSEQPPESAGMDLAAGQSPLVEDTDEAFDLGGGDASEHETCPKCGADLPEMAVICVACGHQLGSEGEAGEKAVVEEPPPAPAREPLDKKKIIVGAAAAAVVVALVGGLLVWKPWGGGGKRPAQPASADRGRRPADTASERQPDTTPRERRRPAGSAQPKRDTPAAPAVSADWGDFESPLLKRRDSARRLAEAVVAYREANDGKVPARGDLDALLAGFAYSPHPVAGRFAILAWESDPQGGLRYGVFNDGSVRGLTEQQWTGALLGDSPYGLVTADEKALLETLHPGLRLVNERFGSLTLVVDGQDAATVGQFDTVHVKVEEGVREIAFKTDGETSASLEIDCRPGAVAELGFRRHGTRPVVRAWDIQRAAVRSGGRQNPRQVVQGGKLVQLRMGSYDVYNMGDNSIRVFRESRFVEGNTCRAVDGRIRFENREVVGPAADPLGRARTDDASIRNPNRQPLLANAIERLAEGDVYYDNGAVEQYRILDQDRETRFGSVCVLVSPSPSFAEYVRVVPPQAQRDRTDRVERDIRDRRRSGRGTPEGTAEAKALPAPLDFAWPPLGNQVDIQAIREPLAKLGSPTRDALMALVLRALREKPAEVRRTDRGYAPDPNDMYFEEDEFEEEPMRAETQADTGPVGREQPAGAVLSPEEALALAGLYGASDLGAFSRRLEGYPAMQRAAMVGMGFTGEESMAPGIASLAHVDRAGAVLALSAIEGMNSAVAMKTLVARAPAEELLEAMRAAPKGLGPLARSRFLVVLRDSRPADLRDRRFLEAICRFAPGALAEEALYAMLDEEKPKPEPQAGQQRRGPEYEDDLEDDMMYEPDDMEDTRARAFSPDETRLWAARALASVGHRKTVAWLVQALESGSEQDKALAILALRETVDPSLAGAFARGLALRDPVHRAVATEALLSIANDDALALVRHRLETEGDIAFRLTLDAAAGLRQRVGDAAAAKLLASLWRGALKQAEPAPKPERGRGEDPMDDDMYYMDDEFDPMDPAGAYGGRPGRRPAESQAPAAPLDIVRPLDVLRAVKDLAAYDPDLFAAVTEGLDHKSPQVRAAAVSALAWLIQAAPAGERDGLASQAIGLAEKRANDENMTVAAAAVDTIARVSAQRGQDYVPDLAPVRQGLESDDAEAVVAALELAVGFSENPELPGLLQSVIYKYSGVLDSPDAIRILAKLAETFGRLDMADSAPLLRQLLLNPDRSVRLAAVRALGRIGNPSSVEFLSAAITDSDDEVRRAATVALAGASGGVGIPRLASLLRGDEGSRRSPDRGQRDLYDDTYTDDMYMEEDPYAEPRGGEPSRPGDLKTLVIAEALRHGTPDAFRGLKAGIAQDDVAGLRLVAELAPAALPDNAADAYVEFLSGYLASGNARVRALAADSIRAAVPPARAVALLKPHAEDRPVGILPALAAACVEADDRTLVEQFEKWYPDGPVFTRAGGEAQDMDDMVGPADRSVRVDDLGLQSRKAAIMAVGRLGGEDAVKKLRQTMFGRKVQGTMVRVRRVDRAGKPFVGPSDADAEIHSAFIRAYAATGQPEAVAAIASRDAPYNNMFRPVIIEALAECGHLDVDEARKALMAALRDPDPRVSASAADALDDIRNRVRD